MGALKGWLKVLLKCAAYCAVYVVVFEAISALLALFVVNIDHENENAAYHAVIDYANSKIIGLPPGDPDRGMLVKPYQSESCPAKTLVMGLRWRPNHPCWIVEYPTSFNTYRWFVDLRDPPKVGRTIIDHGKAISGELYEYKVRRLPPFDSYYPDSKDWSR
jgi:hypothetical protein